MVLTTGNGSDKNSRNGSDTSRTGTDTSQNVYDSSRNVYDSSRNVYDSSRNGTDISRNQRDTSRNVFDYSRNGADVSRNVQDTTRNGTDNSRNVFDTSSNGYVSSRNGHDTSRNGADVSRNVRDTPRNGTDNSRNVFETSSNGYDSSRNGTDPASLRMVPSESSLHMGSDRSSYRQFRSFSSLNSLIRSDSEFGISDSPPVPIKQRVKNWCLSICTLETLKSKFPIISWLPKYNLFNLQCDLIAGITVALTLIPQSLAYAGIAGLAPQYGLYSAFICVFIYCIMGSSKDITLGPSAIVCLITASFATSISPKLPSGEADPTMAIMLAFTTGLIQIGMSFLKLGIIVNFISFPVINAFSSAAAITIAVSQLKTLLGVHDVPNDFVESLNIIRKKLPEVNLWDMTMGMSCIIVVSLLRKLREIKWHDEPDVPIPLHVTIYRKIIFICGAGSTAIVVMAATTVLFIFEKKGLTNLTPTGVIQPGMPEIRFPNFDIHIGNYTMPTSEMFYKISIGVIVVPIIALMEAMAIGKYFARVNKYKIDPTQELLSYGIGNLMTSFFQGFAVTGTFSRTAINSQCGVKTPLGNIFTGVIVILSLYVLTPMFYYIPKCALAGVIIAAVLAMVDIRSFKMLYRANKLDVIPYFVTFISTLLIGIQWGIFVGMGVSLAILLYPIARPKVLFTTVQGFMIVTPTQGLNFPGAEYLEMKAVDRALAVEQPHDIILNMEYLCNMDFSAVQSVRSMLSECEVHGIKLILAQGKKRVVKQLKAANIKNLLIVETIEEAIEMFTAQNVEDEHEESNEEENWGFFISTV